MQLFKVTTETGAACIDPMDALKRLNSPIPPVIIDVRAENEFHQSHIPGAIWIADEALNEAMDDLPRDRTYVTVCRSGARSGVAAWKMRAAGYNVTNLCGGLLAWQRAGLDVENDN